MTLLFDATSAYLGPLLEKHAAGQPLVWEDLVAAQAACSAILRQSNNEFVSSRLNRLHQSQINAYRKAANQAIKDWALSVPLQPMEETDTKTVFVERCIAAISTAAPGTNALPNWHLSTAKATATTEIRRRATAIYEKYHPVEEADEGKNNGSGTANASEAIAVENGAETEDGEATSDGISDDDGQAQTSKPAAGKSNQPNRNKKGSGQKIIATRKKGTNAKGGPRGIRGGRGIRQGGRGRGNGK